MTSLDQEIARLRERASKVLAQKSGTQEVILSGGEMQDAMRLLEELRVYQTELEIQNQDLRAAQQVAEHALQKYHRLFESMPLAGVIVDQQGFVVEGNAAARQQFGLREQTSLQRRSLYQLFGFASRTAVHLELTRNKPLVTVKDLTVSRKDTPEHHIVDLHILTLGQGDIAEAHRLVLMVDRTAQWELENKQTALLESETNLLAERRRLNGILEGTRAGTWEWDLFSGSVTVNPHWVEMLGYSSAELLPLDIEAKWSLVHPQDRVRAQTLLDDHLHDRLPFYECELRMQHKQGDWIWVVERALVVQRNAENRPILLAGTQIDVSESVRLRQRVEANYALLTNLAQQIPGVIYQFQMFPDGRTCFPFASQGIQRIYEVSAEQVAQDASPIFEALHPLDRDRVAATIAQSAKSLQPWVCEFRVQLPVQGVRWRSGTAQPERMADGSTLWHGFIADITDHKVVEERLLEFNRNFEGFLDQTSDFVYFKDKDSRFRFCSQTLARICGYPDWRQMLGKHDLEVFPREVAEIYQAEEVPVLRDGVPLLNKVDPYFDDQGQPGFVQTNKWPLFDEQGSVVGIFGISRDVSESMRAQTRVRLAASVFTHAREAIMITDANGQIVEVNDSFNRITGYAREEAVGSNPRILRSGRQGADFYARMWSSITIDGYWTGEIWNRRKNGEVFAEMATISAVRDEAKQVINYVCLFTDITSLKEHQNQLEHVAHYDVLTGLPNRLLLADRLQQALLQTERRNKSLSVVFVDLDGFKAVNDTFGHSAGDELLVTVAQRMKLALREGDSLARVGGDEFVVVLVDLDNPDDCLPVLDRILLAAAEPVQVHAGEEERQAQVSASIGATIFPRDGADADILLRHADQAMYLAKQAGKNRYHLFDVAHDDAVKSMREGQEQIQRALRDGEFELFFQPKVNYATGAVLGMEALIRWRRPKEGLLPPAKFLPLVEHHPLGIAIGEWVIESALQHMQHWRSMGLTLPVSVNVGSMQLQQKDFVGRLETILGQYAYVAGGGLELEILESSALQDLGIMAELLNACHTLGVSFALDDFGTGYSSLRYLKHLPAGTLKIDQSFVRDMLIDPDDLSIVRGVIGLAHAFGRHVIAEGVETLQHAQMLMEIGCPAVQGYGIARPMPASEVFEWVQRWNAQSPA